LTGDLRFGIRFFVSERLAFTSFADALAHAEALL
jgi:hypothetical protein